MSNRYAIDMQVIMIIKSLSEEYGVKIYYDYNAQMLDYLFLIIIDEIKYRIFLNHERIFHAQEILKNFILSHLYTEID